MNLTRQQKTTANIQIWNMAGLLKCPSFPLVLREIVTESNHETILITWPPLLLALHTEHTLGVQAKLI